MALRRRSIWVRLGIALPLLLLGIWLISLIGVVYWEQRDDARPSAAIVVLGAAQYVGRPSPVLRARLDHSLELWKRCTTAGRSSQ